MARKALVEVASGRVRNVIAIEDGSSWPIPDGCVLLDGGRASPGDTWDGTGFVSATPTEAEVLSQQRAAARARATAAILANAANSPWGVILHDLAIADGHIEP